MVLIDTSILIEHVRTSNKSASTFYSSNEKEEIGIAMMTAWEFLIGKNHRNENLIETLLQQLHIFDWNQSMMRKAVEIYIDLKGKNQLVSTPDIIIAATAVTKGLPLATLNKKHFKQVERLQLI